MDRTSLARVVGGAAMIATLVGCAGPAATGLRALLPQFGTADVPIAGARVVFDFGAATGRSVQNIDANAVNVVLAIYDTRGNLVGGFSGTIEDVQNANDIVTVPNLPADTKLRFTGKLTDENGNEVGNGKTTKQAAQ